MEEAITIRPYLAVAERAAELGLEAPRTLALLPRNFESAVERDELLDEASAATIHQLLHQAGLPEERFDSPQEPFLALAQHAVDWYGPTLFLSAGFINENPLLVGVAINLITDYVRELFGRVPGRRRAHLAVVVERDAEKESVRISYDGEIEGIKELVPAVERAISDGH
jgi:hypothetical protein